MHEAWGVFEDHGTVNFEQDRFVREYIPPTKPGPLKKALAEPVCRYPLLERLVDKLGGTELPGEPQRQVAHLAAIVRHPGRVGVHRTFSGASTNKLVADVKRWRTHASEEACKAAVQDGSEFLDALDEIGTGTIGRGLSRHSRDFLIDLVRQGGEAYTDDPDQTDEENEHGDSSKELGDRIEREKVKRETKVLAWARRRCMHTDLNAHLDGMNHAARMSFLLERSPQDRQVFEDPNTWWSEKKAAFERALAALDDKLEKVHFKPKDRAVIRAKFTYRGVSASTTCVWFSWPPSTATKSRAWSRPSRPSCAGSTRGWAMSTCRSGAIWA